MFFLSLVIAAGLVSPPTAEQAPASRTAPSPFESRPLSFHDATAPLPLRTGGNTVLLIVADYVAEPLEYDLATFQSDLVAEGWNPVMHVMSGGTAQDMKDLLASTPNIDGAIFVGFLPAAWYEEDYWADEEFPCELFFMDLNGVWTDSDGNGLYDSHTGHVAPEIWVGRIDAHAADFGSEILMLSEYFQKNHLYRTGAMAPPSRALAYIDDDWSGYTHCGLNSIYGPSGVTVENSPWQTTAVNYVERLHEGYEFVHLMSHSSPLGHTFKQPSGMAGTVMAPEIAQVNPATAFLQLFACSNARWVETGCLGNWYLFGTDTGLLVSGAAKTGSMLDFEEFYGPVGSGATFGEAFRSWWQYQAAGGFSSSQRAWFYGNALLGDPTLKPVTNPFASIPPPSEAAYGEAFSVSTSQHSDCFPSVATMGNLTAVVWLTAENGRLDIASRFHDDSMDSWSQVYPVDSDEYWDASPVVCFHGNGEPWAAWSDFEYATYSYRIKVARGIPLADTQVAVPQDGYQVSPALAFTDRMWLAWQDWTATGGRIMIKTLEGTPWENQLSTPEAWAVTPSISPGPDGELHALWIEHSPGGSSVMWSYGNETGFSEPVALSQGDFCHSPSIGLIDGTLVAAWQSDGISSSIAATIWDGAQWLLEQNIVLTAGHIMNPVVCAGSGGQPSVYWQQGRANAIPMGSAYNGSQWSEPFQPFYHEGPVWNPVFSGGRFFWAGTQGEDWNIYTTVATGIEGGGTGASSFLPTIGNNPVTGTLRMTLGQSQGPYRGAVRIFDISGRTVSLAHISMEPGEVFSIDLSHLPAGVYTVVADGAPNAARFTLLH
jgi:hypothetical protein